MESREDVKGGVQKFRVKLLAESGGQSTMDVLCQVEKMFIYCLRVRWLLNVVSCAF